MNWKIEEIVNLFASLKVEDASYPVYTILDKMIDELRDMDRRLNALEHPTEDLEVKR